MARKRGGTGKRLLFLIVTAALAFVALAAFRAGPPPQITIDPQLPGIGKQTPIEITVREPKRGLAGVRVELIQGERAIPLDERVHVPRPPWAFWGARSAEERFVLNVGSDSIEGLQEGDATLRVVAERASSWLRYPEAASVEVRLPVRLRPPSIQVTSEHVYVTQGGCEAVVYRVGPTAVRDGVQSGDWWFPGWPYPGGDAGMRFALFAAPYDLSDGKSIRLVTEDDVGNGAEVPFVERFNPRALRTDTIRIDDNFMQRVVPAILSQTTEVRDTGDLLQNYLAINNDLRGRNARVLIELARDSRPEFLWSRSFLQMRNAKVMSNFADRRTYVYNGADVDRQDHLGYDLASTRMADIEAANDGVVVLARYFGIYGNAVVLDHGYGLMSLYGHLSSLGVSEGQDVVRGEALGRSGQTGLAGGDHLHFTMLLQGLPVDPREWWDGHWIHDRLELKLGDALPFAG